MSGLPYIHIHTQLCSALQTTCRPNLSSSPTRNPSPVAGDQHVYAQVELLAADQQRVLHVPDTHTHTQTDADTDTDTDRTVLPGYDVGLLERHLGPAALRAPLLDLRQLVDDEDALALRPAAHTQTDTPTTSEEESKRRGIRGGIGTWEGAPGRGLHDPHGVGVAAELLHEQSVVRRKQVRHRNEVGLTHIQCIHTSNRKK